MNLASTKLVVEVLPLTRVLKNTFVIFEIVIIIAQQLRIEV